MSSPSFDETWAACDRIDQLVRLAVDASAPERYPRLFVTAHRCLSLLRGNRAWSIVRRVLWPLPTDDDVLDTIKSGDSAGLREVMDGAAGFGLLCALIVGVVEELVHWGTPRAQRSFSTTTAILAGVTLMVVAIVAIVGVRRLRRRVAATSYPRAFELLIARLDAIRARVRPDVYAREVATTKLLLRRDIGA